MADGYVAYIIALAAFGTASGLEITGKRRGEILLPPAGMVASLAGLIDLALIVGAFFRFGLAQGAIAVGAGAIATALLCVGLPSAFRPGFIYLFALIGVVTMVVSFF